TSASPATTASTTNPKLSTCCSFAALDAVDPREDARYRVSSQNFALVSCWQTTYGVVSLLGQLLLANPWEMNERMEDGLYILKLAAILESGKGKGKSAVAATKLVLCLDCDKEYRALQRALQ